MYTPGVADWLGLGETYPLLPPGSVLRKMTQTELVRVMHQLAQMEFTARWQMGDQVLAQMARDARIEASNVYKAFGEKDLSRLDKAALLVDRINQVIAASAREAVVGIGKAAGEAIGTAARGALPVIPLLLVGGALWLLTTGKLAGVVR